MKKWSKTAYKLVKKDVNYCNGEILHLYHGNKKNRKYFERTLVLGKYNFNPKTDIKINKKGILTWTTNKTQLIKAVKEYFL